MVPLVSLFIYKTCIFLLNATFLCFTRGTEPIHLNIREIHDTGVNIINVIEWYGPTESIAFLRATVCSRRWLRKAWIGGG